MIERLFIDKNELIKYIEKIKKIFIGKSINGIYIADWRRWQDSNLLYEYDEKIGHRLYYDKNANEEVEISIEDDYVTIKIDDLFFTLYSLELKRYNSEFAMQLTISKDNDDDEINIAHYYSKNVTNQKIKDVYFDECHKIHFLLENDYEFIVRYWNDCLIYERILKKENSINYNTLIDECYYEKFSILNNYINEIKPKLIGNKIEKIMRLGEIFEESYENKRLHFDEFIDIQIGNEHLNFDFAEDSEAFISLNLFDYTETSCMDDGSWRSLNCIYKNNIIGQTVKDIVVTKYDNTHIEDKEIKKHFADKFISVEIHLENGYMFKITNSHDYTVTSEHLIEKTKN